MKKSWIIIGIITLIICSLCLCCLSFVVWYAITYPVKSTSTITNPISFTEAGTPQKQQVLKEVDVFNQSGTGRNSSSKFELTGGKITVHYKISNNSDCYNDSYFNQRPCYASFANVQMHCDKDKSLFDTPEIILGGVLGDGEKDLTFYYDKGTCYFDIQLNESAAWSFSVKEERMVDVE